MESTINPEARPSSTESERSTALWMHLGPLIATFVNMIIPLVPLGLITSIVLYASNNTSTPYVKFHARESLNFQITITLIGLIMVGFAFITFGSVFLSTITGGGFERFENDGRDQMLGFIGNALLIAFAFLAVGIASVVLMIIASIKAANGEKWPYPINIRFVK